MFKGLENPVLLTVYIQAPIILKAAMTLANYCDCQPSHNSSDLLQEQQSNDMTPPSFGAEPSCVESETFSTTSKAPSAKWRIFGNQWGMNQNAVPSRCGTEKISGEMRVDKIRYPKMSGSTMFF